MGVEGGVFGAEVDARTSNCRERNESEFIETTDAEPSESIRKERKRRRTRSADGSYDRRWLPLQRAACTSSEREGQGHGYHLARS